MKASVIVFPGSNCDRDVKVALGASLGRDPAMVWHGDSQLPPSDLIVLPGGFSYGDYLRCGAVAARSPIMADVVARARAGTPVLGICNGFQILIECGLLPGALMRNRDLHFICRDVHLRIETADSVFTRGYRDGQVVRFPIAHHDGNYFIDAAGLERLEGDGQVALRYCDAQGRVDDTTNPNGSCANIAGVFDRTRNVLGMMPHPERLADAKLGGTDGKPLFDGLMEALS